MKKIIILLIVLCCSIKSNAKTDKVLNLADTLASKKFLELGVSKYNLKDYKGAIYDFEMAVKNQSDNWKAYRYKGDAEFEIGDYKTAVFDYTQALMINPKDLLSYKGRGETYRILGENNKALEDYNIAISWDPEDYEIYFGRGSSYYELKKYRESIEDFNQGLKIEPNIPSVYYLKARAYLCSNRYRETVGDINKYFQLQQKKGDDPYGGYYIRGQAYWELNKLDSAQMDFSNHLIYNPNDHKSLRYLGMIYSAKKDSVLARRYFNESLKLKPNESYTYIKWGNAELDIFDNYSKASELFSLAKVKDKGESKSTTSDIYYKIGYSQIGLHDTLGMIGSIETAVSIDSNNYKAYYARAFNLIFDSKYDSVTQKDITSLIRIFNDTDTIIASEFYYYRSIIKFRSFDSLGCISDINKSIKLSTDNAPSYFNRSYYNYIFHQSQDIVLADLNKALNLDVNYTEAYLLKAAVYTHFGNFTSGCMNLKKAMKLGAKVTKKLENYICQGKAEDEVIPYIPVDILPKVFNNSEFKNKKNKQSPLFLRSLSVK